MPYFDKAASALRNAPYLAEIEAFCRRYGVSPSTLGSQALGDRALISNLRSGRRLHPETREKLDSFMARVREDTEADKGAA